jgi:hypothetical protein
MPIFGNYITKAVRARRNIRHFFELISYTRKASKLFNKNFFFVFRRALHLKFKSRFDPRSIFLLGLLDPQIDFKDVKKLVSREKLSHLQLKFNPREWGVVTENKGIFYRYCEAYNLPIPKLYAIYNRKNTGYCYTGKPLITKKDYLNFIEFDLPADFIIKPSAGVYGSKIYAFRKNDNSIVDHLNNAFSAKQVAELMTEDKEFNSFIIQERLFTHELLAKLCSSKNLNTLRVNTFVESNGDINIISVTFKSIAGDNLIDNQSMGMTGNLISGVDVATGLLTDSLICHPDGRGLETVEIHPDTGKKFKGFKIPEYDRVIEIAKDAANKFRPITTIGWDIAVADKGVFILEGNMFYDISINKSNADKILNKLSNRVKELA